MDKLNIKEAGLKVTQPRIRILKILEPQSRNILVPRSCFIFLAEKEAHKIKILLD